MTSVGAVAELLPPLELTCPPRRQGQHTAKAAPSTEAGTLGGGHCFHFPRGSRGSEQTSSAACPRLTQTREKPWKVQKLLPNLAASEGDGNQEGGGGVHLEVNSNRPPSLDAAHSDRRGPEAQGARQGGRWAGRRGLGRWGREPG